MKEKKIYTKLKIHNLDQAENNIQIHLCTYFR